MSQRLSCYVLFDVTHTGVMNRSRPQDADTVNWLRRRNTQCNFDTILQVISLRSQPDVVKLPQKIEITDKELDFFGFSYFQDADDTYYCWKFDFEVQHSSVFADSYDTLGALYKDCDGVPMINFEDQLDFSSAFLDTTTELKNIHFEVL